MIACAESGYAEDVAAVRHGEDGATRLATLGQDFDSPAWEVRLFSASDGRLVARRGAWPADVLGLRPPLREVGDRDADGVSDLAVRADLEDAESGALLIVSGADLSLLERIDLDGQILRAFCVVDDRDGDVVPELALATRGRVELRSSRDGSVLAEWLRDAVHDGT